jgi:hypothetical protein
VLAELRVLRGAEPETQETQNPCHRC